MARRSAEGKSVSGDRVSVDGVESSRGAARGKGERVAAAGVPMRIGDVLVRMGVLSKSQRDEVLREQVESMRPFGLIAEELFGVSPSAVERAWATQYASMAPSVDPSGREIEAKVLGMVERRQAWQFRVLPMDAANGELLVATTEECLPRAMRFMGWRVSSPASFVIATPDALGEALCRHYPMGGMRASDVRLASSCST